MAHCGLTFANLESSNKSNFICLKREQQIITIKNTRTIRGQNPFLLNNGKHFVACYAGR